MQHIKKRKVIADVGLSVSMDEHPEAQAGEPLHSEITEETINNYLPNFRPSEIINFLLDSRTSEVQNHSHQVPDFIVWLFDSYCMKILNTRLR